ncbi:uncharacterized protein N7446_005930 [Penicillium canescens]|uniref:Uncharacterized protein n=1 Tax=Penicillium canescens TaxID=5083 RepID=A0AAD6NC75_PENCN|nr:uncharacterized protein N7446_005930 [Penicillium canescens]KAJ6051298.1 hypothetical protein N7460_001832 [Penicillium canescens]KAJ6061810.1 hypothetical protein N7446_005930 [Penicillium canescens]KAJ6065059.1 hypothetical protein N7444_000712 [Penicillium canescens]
MHLSRYFSVASVLLGLALATTEANNGTQVVFQEPNIYIALFVGIDSGCEDLGNVPFLSIEFHASRCVVSDAACGDKGPELEIKGPGKQLDKEFIARSIACYSK